MFFDKIFNKIGSLNVLFEHLISLSLHDLFASLLHLNLSLKTALDLLRFDQLFINDILLLGDNFLGVSFGSICKGKYFMLDYRNGLYFFVGDDELEGFSH